MIALAAVETEVALANLKEVETVAGVTNQMKMTGQNHSRPVNAWNSKILKYAILMKSFSLVLHVNLPIFILGNSFLEAILGLTLRNTMTFQSKQQATTVLHILKV